MTNPSYPPLVPSLPCPAALIGFDGQTVISSAEWDSLFLVEDISKCGWLEEVLQGKITSFTIDRRTPPGGFLFRVNRVTDGFLVVGFSLSFLSKKESESSSVLQRIMSHELTGLACAAEYHLNRIKARDVSEQVSFSRIEGILTTMQEIMAECSEYFPSAKGSYQRASLISVAEKAVALVKTTPSEATVSIRGCWDAVFCDRTRMTLAIRNLVENALKYGKPPKGTLPTVLVEVERSPEEGEDSITIYVRDNGLGIPETDSSSIFDPFYRGGNSVLETGTGLGLFFVKTVAEEHGGRCGVVSPTEGGSVFWIKIPSYVK